MSEYQVIARKYRPQKFKDALGQEAVVTTLQNAISSGRLAHAYLFSGPRGTGKTSIARIFAKALNCSNPGTEHEPCNDCPSCKEITSGSSLDVLEIDGASNRGIDEVRRISETVAYTPASGKYKIVIIDEVHMLTKEAFNALLKTLEEPPSHAKFFFATTELHKVLPTILSRCQRFQLKRLPNEEIARKLRHIAKDLEVNVDEDAIRLIAHAAEGGMRDAESIFDQIISFTNGEVTCDSVQDILGLMPRDTLFAIDRAGKDGKVEEAFRIAQEIYSEGKSIPHFIEFLAEHFRNLMILQLNAANGSGSASKRSLFSARYKKPYEDSAAMYSQEQILYILDLLNDAQDKVRFTSSQQIFLEMTLLKILRSHKRVAVDALVQRLSDIEGTLQKGISEGATLGLANGTSQGGSAESLSSAMAMAPSPPPPPPPPPAPPKPAQQDFLSSPPPQALAKSKKPEEKKIIATPLAATSVPIELAKRPSHYDTLVQFAAVELGGSLRIHKTLRES